MEQQKNHNTKVGGWQQIQYTDRQIIEILLKAGHSAKEIAVLIGYSKHTVEREFKQGAVTLLRMKLGKEYLFCKKVSEHIKNGFSPYSALRFIRRSGESKLRICCKTLYSYIAKDFIPGITNTDLPEKEKDRKRG